MYFSNFLVLTTTMMKLVLIVLFSGIVLMDTVSACNCNGITQYDYNSGRNIGECLTTFNGRPFCYVDPYSGCSDQKYSSRSTPDNQIFYSFNACQGISAQLEPIPYIARK